MSTEVRRARARQMLIFLLVCVGMFALLGRLYYWQIVEAYSGHKLALLASQEHIHDQVLTAARGLIYDANGLVLVTNVVRDDVYIEPVQFSEDHPDDLQEALSQTLTALHSVLPALSVAETRRAFMEALSANRWSLLIAHAITPQQSERLRELALPAVFLAPQTERIYPQGDLAAQVLGYVGYVGGSSSPQGVYGIEAQYNSLLAGKPGNLTAERDLYGNPLVVGASSEEPPVPGANLTLTIDSTIQYFVQTQLAATVKQLGAQGGTVVVLNAQTGAVVAMAGYPDYDPNQYGRYADQTGCLHSEEVYLNPALYCAYEPGSTLKAVTMAAALDQGLITPDTTIYDRGYLTFNDGTPMVTNWQNQAWGRETMTEVLVHSANVGAAYVAHDLLGPTRYYPYLARFGFGQRTGIDSPEATGFYRQPGSPGWTPSDLARQAFGQSILATPLQVALAYQAIANDGVMMRPYLVSAIDANGHVTRIQPQVVRRVISSKAARELTSMLEVAAIDGSAQRALVPGYTVAAKTGTATTQGISEDQTEASVAGFLPASHPRFVILVKLDRPQASIYGGTAAAPLWKAIAQELMWYYHVPPDQSQ
ncbi:MAG: penicillin-binding protein 2 [Thermogemmatispora sp.]|uniref:peptidoglycan D,D-transpeptidase FtsI family protein n=1 Tax=Thermogemmatispora sp. TaxID=1968838 RepID=UPI00262512B9|nr:penicillin-binding protein 2 [Thermogemmatispora sp.]MBX5456438.1 penicillin-binding protein 2 [Thermogemmatispora sp.]